MYSCPECGDMFVETTRKPKTGLKPYMNPDEAAAMMSRDDQKTQDGIETYRQGGNVGNGSRSRRPENPRRD